jgi:hypothetical protein
MLRRVAGLVHTLSIAKSHIYLDILKGRNNLGDPGVDGIMLN